MVWRIKELFKLKKIKQKRESSITLQALNWIKIRNVKTNK